MPAHRNFILIVGAVHKTSIHFLALFLGSVRLGALPLVTSWGGGHFLDGWFAVPTIPSSLSQARKEEDGLFDGADFCPVFKGTLIHY